MAKKLVDVPFIIYKFVPVALVQTRLPTVTGFETTRLLNVPVVANILVELIFVADRLETVVAGKTAEPVTVRALMVLVAATTVPAVTAFER